MFTVDYDLQDFIPGLAAVGRFVKPPLRIFRIKMSQGSHINNIRILRMNNYSSNMMRFIKSHMCPGFTRIS